MVQYAPFWLHDFPVAPVLKVVAREW
jgi:hypothetical protein